MHFLSYIIWSPDPEIFTLPFSMFGWADRPVRWYGLLFALGFILSQQLMIWIFRKEGKPVKDIDVITTYMVLATIIGSRLGHCLFYNPSYYLSNPVEILKIWEGGLASHGGAIGILIGLWIFFNYDIKAKFLLGFLPYSISSKKRKKEEYSFLWFLDRVVIGVALTGALIRTGNFMNSEMEGLETGSDMGVVYAGFTKEALDYDPERIDDIFFKEGGKMTSDVPGQVPITAVIQFRRGVEIDDRERLYIESGLQRTLLRYREISEHIDFGQGKPLQYEVVEKGGYNYVEIYGVGTIRHAAQMYEAAYCFLFMIILFLLWRYKRDKLPEGFNFALFMILLWSARFVDEFFKMDQEPFEATIPLNMGQWLSIPMFLLGVIIMIVAYQKKSRSTSH